MPASLRTGITVAFTLVASALLSQVGTNAPVSQRLPQFDNDSVKVWKTIVQPHQPLALHHHDHPRVIIALTSGTMNLVDSSGTVDAHRWEAGKAYWLPAMAPNTLHSDVNPGEKPLEVMVVELEKEK